MRAMLILVLTLIGLAGAAQATSLELTVARAERAEAMFGSTARIDVALDGASQDAFALYTAARAGRQIWMYVEGDLILSPMLQGAITNGRLTLNAGPGGFNGRSADDLMEYFSSGGQITVSDRPM